MCVQPSLDNHKHVYFFFKIRQSHNLSLATLAWKAAHSFRKSGMSMLSLMGKKCAFVAASKLKSILIATTVCPVGAQHLSKWRQLAKIDFYSQPGPVGTPRTINKWQHLACKHSSASFVEADILKTKLFQCLSRRTLWKGTLTSTLSAQFQEGSWSIFGVTAVIS